MHQRPAGHDPLQRQGRGVAHQLGVEPDAVAELQEQLLGRRGRGARRPAQLVLDRLDGVLDEQAIGGLGPALVRGSRRVHQGAVEPQIHQPQLYLAGETGAQGQDPVLAAELEGGPELDLGDALQPVAGNAVVGPQGRAAAAEVSARRLRRDPHQRHGLRTPCPGSGSPWGPAPP